MSLFRSFFFLLFAICCLNLNAQVVINEYSAANWKQFIDNHNDFEDWVELYNTGAAPVDISGWFLSDNPLNPDKFAIPAGVSIAPGQHLIIWCSKRDTMEGSDIHASFSLNQTKGIEHVVLTDAAMNTIDDQPILISKVQQSWCRTTDGAALWKLCSLPTPGASNDGSPQFFGISQSPTFSESPGYKTEPINVTIECADATASIYYTLNGRRPVPNSIYTTLYTGPVYIDSTKVLKAIAVPTSADLLKSFETFNTYFFHADTFTLAVVSVSADSVTNLANGNGDLRPVGALEYFDINGERQAIATGELNRHGQDSWQNPHRSIDWVSRDEMGLANAINFPLFNGGDRTSYQRIMLRASGDDNYPATNASYHDNSCHIRDEYCHSLAKLGNMELDVRQAERIVVFLNGRYWGVYGLRDYPDDHDYTEHYYNQDKYELQVLETWGDTWAEYGGDKAHEDWMELRDFVLDNDMSVQANYDSVRAQLNVKSMCDYFICGLAFVASDWINYNTGWWRGMNPNGNHKKWGYNLWDFDATFAYYINYSGVPDTSSSAAPCDLESISDYVQNDFYNGITTDTCIQYPWGLNCSYANGMHEVLLNKMMTENEEFRQLYYSRQADLHNTVLSCENMLHVLDSMVAVIAPEMPRQIARWGGSMAEWEENVDRMRNFIDERCSQWGDGMTDCFNLEGPFPITILVEPLDKGWVELNTLNLEAFPFTGNYYGLMEQKLEGHAYFADQPFLYWESTSGSIFTASASDSIAQVAISQGDTIIAHFQWSSNTSDLTAGIALQAYPSPASTFSQLVIGLDYKSIASVQVFNIAGVQLFSHEMGELTPGVHKYTLPIAEMALPDGLYYVEFKTDRGAKSIPLTVVK
jgi:CotH kinase protein/Lamin Tail Domain/Chitobiase/beta-hexosaminidase C-terminal domain